MAQSLDQLSRIDISGYKSIKHCSIELKKTNVIIQNENKIKIKRQQGIINPYCRLILLYFLHYILIVCNRLS